MPKPTRTKKTAKISRGKAAPYTKEAPKVEEKPIKKKVFDPSILFEKRPKNFGIGNDIQPKRDVTRFVKWPKAVKLQRQKRVLLQRLKVPPAVNQFSRTLDKNTATQLFKLLNKYKPEDKTAKQKRLRETAQQRLKKESEGAAAAPEHTKKPVFVKYGINHVTGLIEQKKAKLVIIAHDVDPIELVVWLPALCRKMGTPYCIVKSKSRLGAVVHKKTATALVLDNVNKEDEHEFGQLITAIKENYNEKYEKVIKQWGGGKIGKKSQAAVLKKEKLRAKETIQRKKE